MDRYKGFVDVLVAEANYAGVPLRTVVVAPVGNGVFSLNALFKDGGTARANQRADIFAGDGFVQRQELIQKLVGAKIDAPRGEPAVFVSIDEAAEITDEAIEALASPEKETKDVDSERDDKNEDKPTLEDALAKLDHKDKAHWTQAGWPNLNVLKEYAGRAVTRQELNEAFPEFVRKVEA